MKKLIFVFIVILAIVLIVGCNERRQSDPEFSSGDTTTVITTEDDETSKPLSLRADSEPNAEGGAIAVTSLTENPFETSNPYHLVRGTVSAGAYVVEVNGYKLRKFSPGQTQWRYIASTYVNTLKEGKNDYTVRALDQSGATLATTSFAITYTPATPDSLPGTGSAGLIPLLMTAFLTPLFLRRRIFNE